MNTRIIRLLGGLGILGSLFWLSLNTILAPDWGPPGSTRYLGYEAVNRLWALGFAGMLCGCIGLGARYPLAQSRLGRVAHRCAVGGLLVMIAGNITEFWLFSQQAYGELNVRNLAWIAVLLGRLAVLTGLCLLGITIWRQRFLPALIGVLLALALPITLLITFGIALELMGLPLILAMLLVSGLAAWPGARAAARREAA
jgi:hypothetical protein